MNFEVIRQTLRRTDSAPIIADSINYLTAKFRFSSDWADLEKHVTFTLGANVYDKTLDADDEIKADQGLNLTEGIWTVGVVGVEMVEGEMVERITADTVTILVTVAGALGGEAFPEISGAFGEIILQSEVDRVAAEEARVLAEAERESWYAEASSGNVHSHLNKDALDDVSGVNTGDQDLSDYAKIDDVHTHDNKTALDLVSGINTGDQDLSGYAELDDLHAHSNKTALDNVAGINTGDQDLSSYAKSVDLHSHSNKADLDKVSGTNTGDQDLSSYAKSVDLHTHANKSALDLVSGTNTGDQSAGSFNHNDLANKQGGTTNEFYHVTSAEKTVIEHTSGTNTGDQDVSGAISTHNTDAGAHADKEKTSNKVTSITGTSTDTQYPSAKSVYNSTMRLLISRTIGAGENVSAITWKQDDAGNALALIDMDLRIRIPSNPVAVGTTGSVSLRLNGITSADSYIANTSKSTYTVASYYRTNYGNSIAKLENVGGYMLGTVYYIRDDGTTFGGGNHPIGTLFSAANISQINIFINNITYFPAGTTIEIYGRTA